jgi:hypothetical protein
MEFYLKTLADKTLYVSIGANSLLYEGPSTRRIVADIVACFKSIIMARGADVPTSCPGSSMVLLTDDLAAMYAEAERGASLSWPYVIAIDKLANGRGSAFVDMSADDLIFYFRGVDYHMIILESQRYKRTHELKHFRHLQEKI